MSDLHLYSHKNCPFARRTRMTLLEKGLDFELTEIDLANRPANFSEISPYGKVPVLLHDDGKVYESAIINQYLDECFPDPPLLPGDPMQRAQARIWMDYCDSKFTDASWQHFMAKTADERAAAATQLRDCMEFIETEGLVNAGPYWLGDQLSLVDIQYITFFKRPLENERQDIPAAFTRLHAWLDVMAVRPSFTATAAPA